MRTMVGSINQELGRIAGVQHHTWGNENAKPHVMNCDEWRDHRFKELQEDGIIIKHGHCGPYEAWLLINTKTGTEMIVPQAEIKADYERCCSHKGVTA
jgi:hypothetical protein